MTLEFRERLVSLTLVGCAVVVTGLYVRQELFPVSTTAVAQRGEARPPRFFEGWADRSRAEKRLGPATAVMTIVELADFECPYCREFHLVEEEFRHRHPEEVALVFVHYPLPTHRFGQPAVRASACADAQGGFEGFANLVFKKQDSLGLKLWASYAAESGVRDTVAFKKCLSDSKPLEEVRRGKSFGDYVELSGTPTVLLNGWRVPRAPSADELEASLQAARRHEPPVRNRPGK